MRPLQKKIIAALKTKPVINPEEEIRCSVDFMKEYLLAHSGLKSLVLGISGGQDSTLAGKLAQMAIDELNEESGLDTYQFIAVRLPYGEQLDEADAQAAIDFIRPDYVMTVNIKASTDSMITALEKNPIKISDYNKGNIKARQRMIVQYAVAGQTAGAVIGTDHAAESVTGFYTKFGDGAADLMPLWRLNKTQGTQMLKFLGAPSSLYSKVPTADLEENRPMLADEEALGVTYEAIDAYLRGEEIDGKDAEKIEEWYLKTEHKRHLPITVYDHFWRK